MSNFIYNIITNTWQFGSTMNDKLFRHGADFSSWMTQEQLGISEKDGNKYQPSSGIFKKALKKLNISDKDCILDIGCGKGRAMYMMSGFPFKCIEGYDLSDEMVKVANNNFKITKTDDRCRAFKADAGVFTEYTKYNYFYAFNPVPEVVFKRMLANIIDNIDANPRKCFFIYLNPVYDSFVIAETKFKPVFKIKGMVDWNDVCVYTYSGK